MVPFKSLFILLIAAGLAACAPADTSNAKNGAGGNEATALELYAFYDLHLPNGGGNYVQFTASNASKYRIFVYGATTSNLQVGLVDAPNAFTMACNKPSGTPGKQVCLTSIATQNKTYQFRITESSGLAQDYVVAVAELNGERGEGSVANPVVLSLNTPYAAHLGGSNGVMGTSYFSFTTSTAGMYRLVIGDDLPPLGGASKLLYSDANFTTSVFATVPNEYALEASTTYFLMLQNSNASSWYHRFNITIESH